MANPIIGGRLTCEGCLDIDVRNWQRQKLLSDGSIFPWYYSCAGVLCASLSVEVRPHAVVLRYHARNQKDAAWRPAVQSIGLDWTDCHLGGRRPWFRCGLCGGRAAILYAPDAQFACRRCHGLAYESQQESPFFRNISRARKIRMRLGGGEDLCQPFPKKPRGMHRATYERLRAQGEAADAVAFGQLRYGGPRALR